MCADDLLTMSPYQHLAIARASSILRSAAVEGEHLTTPSAGSCRIITGTESRMRSISVKCLVMLFVASAPVHGQASSAAPALPGAPTAASVEHVTLGSTIGWIVGLAAGVGAGYALQPDAGESYIGAAEWWIGGWVGSSIGSALGAHLANGSEGNLPLVILGSFSIAPVAVLVGVVATPLVVPLAQVGISVVIERRTDPNRR